MARLSHAMIAGRSLVASSPVNAGELLDRAVKTLKASPAIDHWQRDRELIESEDLLCHALGLEDLDRETEVPAAARRRFERMIERRAGGEPVQLIKGYAIFRGLEVIARPGVFVPRDSTEFLAAQAVRRLRRRRRPILVDVATGGGTVALAVVNEHRPTRVYGTDISADAIRVARANAHRLRLRATFVVGNLFGAVPKDIRGSVDVVTLHPPYVARTEMRELPDEIRRWEPAHTLTDRSPDGLGLIERTTAEARSWLTPGGWLLIEVSPDRARSVLGVMRRNGFRDVRSTADRAFKVTRVIVGRWPGRGED
jgi:release factor glutamine methyltransferase